MTKTRRTFLKLALAATSAAPVLGPSVSRFVQPAKAAPGFHMVNGWILTDADLAALRDYGV